MVFVITISCWADNADFIMKDAVDEESRVIPVRSSAYCSSGAGVKDGNGHGMSTHIPDTTREVEPFWASNPDARTPRKLLLEWDKMINHTLELTLYYRNIFTK